LKNSVEGVSKHINKYEVDKEARKTKKIGFVHICPEDHPYIAGMIKNGLKTAKNYGYEFIIKCPKNYQFEEQEKFVQELENAGVDHFILAPADQDKFLPIINRLDKKGIKSVCVDTDSPDSNRISFIGTDNFAAGKNMGEVILKYLPNKKGKIIISMVTEVQRNMQERIQGIKEVLENYKEINILSMPQTGIADIVKRSKNLEEMLRKNPDVNLIAGIDADFVLAVEHMKKNGEFKGIKVIGFDNMPVNIQAVKDGVADAVIAQRQDIFAEIAIRKLYDYDSGKSSQKIEMMNTFEINKAKAAVIKAG
jgi:methyl-accepting chemotaxis protein